MLIRRFVRRMARKWEKKTPQPCLNKFQTTDLQVQMKGTQIDRRISEQKYLSYIGNPFWYCCATDYRVLATNLYGFEIDIKT